MPDTDRPDLDAIAAREQAATPGPWSCSVADDCIAAPDLTPWDEADGLPVHVIVRYDQDGPFIAAARQDVPALVGEVRRLTAELETARRDTADTQSAPGTYDVEDRPVETPGYWQRLVLAELLDIPTDDDSLDDPDVGMWERAYGAAGRDTASLRKALAERDRYRAAWTTAHAMRRDEIDARIAEARRQERERCADLVDTYPGGDLAAGIRALGDEPDEGQGDTEEPPPTPCPVCGRAPADQEYGPDGRCRHTTATRVHRTAEPADAPSVVWHTPAVPDDPEMGPRVPHEPDDN